MCPIIRLQALADNASAINSRSCIVFLRYDGHPVSFHRSRPGLRNYLEFYTKFCNSPKRTLEAVAVFLPRSPGYQRPVLTQQWIIDICRCHRTSSCGSRYLPVVIMHNPRNRRRLHIIVTTCTISPTPPTIVVAALPRRALQQAAFFIWCPVAAPIPRGTLQQAAFSIWCPASGGLSACHCRQ